MAKIVNILVLILISNCIVLRAQIIDSPTDAKNAAYSKDLRKNDFPKGYARNINEQEYGYGFWMRFLTTYPTRLWNGMENGQRYFVARLTSNEKVDDKTVGDNLLTVWTGVGYYQYISCNTVNDDPAQFLTTSSPLDIEGVWTYIYYSFSKKEKLAVGFIKFGDQNPNNIQLEVTHPNVNQNLRFMVGGEQLGNPGFNGQIQDISFRMGKGSFIKNSQQFLNKAGPTPSVIMDKFVAINQVKQTETFVHNKEEQKEEYIPLLSAENAFPQEYSVGGWFKWNGPYVREYHALFRLTLNNEVNKNRLNAGEYVLSIDANKLQYYECATYTYTDMVGGVARYVKKNVNHAGENEEWHFVYFGYSKLQSQAFAAFQFQSTSKTQLFDNIHHFWANQLYLLLKTQYSTFQGKIAYLYVNIGKGAYLSETNYNKDNNIYRFTTRTTRALSNIRLTPIDSKYLPPLGEQ